MGSYISSELRRFVAERADHLCDLLKFGNVDAVKEIYRDQKGLPLTETLLRDVRYALRRLRRTPAFTAAVLRAPKKMYP